MKNLLVAVDFSNSTEPTIAQASILSKALGAKLWILHVTSDEAQALIYDSTAFNEYSPEFTTMPGDVELAHELMAEEIKREHKELLGISEKLRNDGIDVQAILIKGDAAKLIVEKATELEAEMIILGSHGHGILYKALLGGVSESVIRHTKSNVLIVPSTPASNQSGGV